MSKMVKELITGELTTSLKGVNSLVVVDAQGLTAKDDNALRRVLKNKRIRFRVVKNALARRALAANGIGGVDNLLVGPSALAFGAVADVEIKDVAGEIVGLLKKYPQLKVKGGLVEGQTVDAEGVKGVASGPGRREYIGRVVSLLRGPGSRIASLIASPASNLLGVIRDVEKKAGEAATAAAAPAAPAADAPAAG